QTESEAGRCGHGALTAEEGLDGELELLGAQLLTAARDFDNGETVDVLAGDDDGRRAVERSVLEDGRHGAAHGCGPGEGDRSSAVLGVRRRTGRHGAGHGKEIDGLRGIGRHDRLDAGGEQEVPNEAVESASIAGHGDDELAPY